MRGLAEVFSFADPRMPLLARLKAALAPTYLVERELAQGGSSVVFLARDAALQRDVAIKVIRPELATARALERFSHEARTLANLNHPNIVPVYAAGETDGLFYFVMPYLLGDTLAERIARNPLSPREAAQFGAQILDALAAAHRVGVVHRDVTARNVFVVDGTAMLADFGIADAVNAVNVAVAGTVGAMAPEQSTGGSPAAATDIFAVGSLLYEAITGQRWRMMATPDADAWQKVPRRVARVLRRALAWSPAERYATAADFKHALTAATSRVPLVVSIAVIAAVTLSFVVFRARPDAAVTAKASTDLAILPFQTSATGSNIGEDLANLVSLSLQSVPDLILTSPNFIFRWAEAARAKPGEPNFGELNAKHHTSGTVIQTGNDLLVRVTVSDDAEHTVASFDVRGPADSMAAVADSVALQILLAVNLSGAFGPVAPVSRNVHALAEFLLGEKMFRKGAWKPADQHYRAALAFDSTFVLAAWRLFNVWRWLATVEPDPHFEIDSLYKRYGKGLPDVDRRLIQAQLQPRGKERIALLAEATRLYPRDGYAALIYADEVFHRGPLVGIPTTQAMAELEKAASLDPYLAPAWEHLTWAAIRLEQKDLARRALDRLHEVAAPAEDVDVDTPHMLDLAFAARFDPATPLKPENFSGGLQALRWAARGGITLGIPYTQIQLGEWLQNAPDATAADRGSGHEARGIALVMLGRGAEAIAAFDSAAALLATSEAALQAAEWRVVPAALGYPLVSAAEQAAGRAALQQFAQQPDYAKRATWALSLPAGGTLDAADSVRKPLDPFARATLHMLRAKSLQGAYHFDEAEQELIWTQNQDLFGWPSGPAQAAEIDWGFTVPALLQRSAIEAKRGKMKDACALWQQAADLWQRADAPLKNLLSDAHQRVKGCGA